MFKNENKVLKTCVFRKNAVPLHPHSWQHAKTWEITVSLTNKF